MLLRLSDLIQQLQLLAEEEEEEEEEGPPAITTHAKYKGRTVAASEEVILNKIPVSGATICIAIYLF